MERRAGGAELESGRGSRTWLATALASMVLPVPAAGAQGWSQEQSLRREAVRGLPQRRSEASCAEAPAMAGRTLQGGWATGHHQPFQ
jgi:hypothetical protein